MSEEEKVELEELYENSEWWHNRFNAVQRDYEELTKRNKELEDGFKAAIEELSEYATKIDKAIEYINNGLNAFEKIKDKDLITNRMVDIECFKDLLEILGDKE